MRAFLELRRDAERLLLALGVRDFRDAERLRLAFGALALRRARRLRELFLEEASLSPVWERGSK